MSKVTNQKAYDFENLPKSYFIASGTRNLTMITRISITGNWLELHYSGVIRSEMWNCCSFVIFFFCMHCMP